MGVNGSAPGRKSTPRLSPTLGLRELLDLDVGLGPRELGVELGDHELGDRQAERARQLAADDLGDQRCRALAGAAELHHVEPVVVGFDQARQRAALAQRRDVAGRVHPPQRGRRRWWA